MNWFSLEWVTKTRRAATVVGKRAFPAALCALVAVGAAHAVQGCSTAAPAAPGSGSSGSQTVPTPVEGTCDHPNPGCACSQPAETASCGKLILKSGDFFQCEMGTTTCTNGTWSACDGDIKVEEHAISGGGIAIRGLGSPMACGKVDPCDPYCYVQVDTAPGIDASASGLTVADSGLQIALPTNIVTCDLAWDLSASYKPQIGSAYAGLPQSCTGGTGDNCNMDYTCSLGQCTNGKCKPADVSCSPECNLGQACTAATDCASGVCTGGFCAVPACSPNCVNGTDCGGSTDCASKFCNNGTCAAATCAPSCNDGQPCGAATDCASGICTAGACVAPACKPNCAAGAVCGANGDCTSGTCTNGRCKGTSTFTCSPTCNLGQACGAASDCGSGVCTAGFCVAPACGPTCADGAHCGANADCGSQRCVNGTCGPSECAPDCVLGQPCGGNTDCGSGKCTAGLCVASACSPSCGTGAACGANGDCTSALCVNGKCKPAAAGCGPTCADGAACVSNGDCGSGLCSGSVCQAPGCSPTCTIGNNCGANADCSSLNCVNGTCASPACAPSCADGVHCGTNTDCGSNVCSAAGLCQPPACGPSCPNGAYCGANADCATSLCSSNHCKPNSCAPNCNDGITCGASTDCGSQNCVAGVCTAPTCSPTCGTSAACGANGDCASGNCLNGRCKGTSTFACSPDCADGAACGANTDCGSGTCTAGACVAPACGPACPIGNNCGSNSDCGSGVCNNGKCKSPTCSPTCIDGQACGSSVDCGSGICANGLCVSPACAPTCADGNNCGSNGDCGSGQCNNGKCKASSCAPLCNDGEPCGGNNDCGSKLCAAGVCQSPACSPSCPGGASCGGNLDCYSVSGGKCAPYGAGETNPSCTTLPDFTVGSGCWTGAVAADLMIQVCNRGNVSANAGNLVLAIESNAPNPVLGVNGTSCAAGSLVATGPTLPNSASSGKCTIALASLPGGGIPAGACVSFNPSMSTGAFTCVNGTGAGAINLAGPNIFMVVNPPATIIPGNVPLMECDSCNNYTSVLTSEIPTASAGNPVCPAPPSHPADPNNQPNPPTPPAGCPQPTSCVLSECGTTGGSSSGSCITTISGQVMDPGQNVGLSDIEVYIPTSAPQAFVDPVGGSTLPPWDTCTSLNTPFTNGVATDVNGNFSLTLPYGAGTTVLPYLVIQSGRWRRIVKNTMITGCGPNPLPNTATHLPATSLNTFPTTSQGDIPKMAVVTGNQEALECWLAKIGISETEIAAYQTSPGGTAGDTTRISLYQDNGASSATLGGSIPSYNAGSNSLLSAANPTINNYTAVLWPCNGSQPSASAPAGEVTDMFNYANAGGRMFMNHWAGNLWLQYGPANWAAVGTWGTNNGTAPASGLVLNTTADQQLFHAWAVAWDTNNGDAFGPGWISSAVPRETLLTVTGPSAVNLIEGQDTNAWNAMDTNGTYSLSAWFNTPTGAGAGNYEGRIVFNDMHVSGSRGSASGAFPAECTLTPGLTSEELALEYQFFQVTACNLGVSQGIPPPPPPPPPPAVTPQTFTRVFSASCAPGFSVQWGFFEWQSVIPNGTSVVFTAQTSSSGTGGWGVPVPIGTATATTAPMTWMATASSVSADLTAASPPQTSQAWIQVNMTFNPQGAASPVLNGWQQLYDCIP